MVNNFIVTNNVFECTCILILQLIIIPSILCMPWFLNIQKCYVCQEHKLKLLHPFFAAENFLISVNPKDPTCYYLKLCNFSCAVTKDSVQRNQELAEDLSQKLPPHLVPPEVWIILSVNKKHTQQDSQINCYDISLCINFVSQFYWWY